MLASLARRIKGCQRWLLSGLRLKTIGPIAMSTNNRKAVRKKLSASVYLYTSDGWPIGACAVLDISEGGAKLAHTLSDPLPGKFLLSFSRNGNVRRPCTLAWAKERQIGIHFSEQEE